MLKTPATKRGLHDATEDKERIALWNNDGAKYNWAVNCGASGLFVVDIDPAGFDYWDALLASSADIGAACAATYQVRTPRGGMHYYWRGAGRSTASEIAPGVDTRGIGGYVVLPGGQTAAGAYEYISGDIQPLPKCIATLLSPEKIRSPVAVSADFELDSAINISKAGDLLGYYASVGNVAVENAGGNARTYQTAARMFELGLSVDVVHSLMIEHWNDHCVPPWDSEELYIVVQNAARYAQEVAGAKGEKSNAAYFAAWANYDTNSIESPPPSIKRKSARLLTILEARALFKPPHWLIPDYIPATGIGMIYGAPGSYKSFMAMDMAMALATGLASQWPVAPFKHDVIYLAGEGQSNFVHSRLSAWLQKWVPHADHSEIATYGFRIFEHGVPAHSHVEHWGAICDGIDELAIKPSLIVIDTMARLISGMDENSAKDATLITGFMESIANRYQCFVLGIHHTGKDVAKGARGSSAFLANMDSVFHAFKNDNLISLQVKKHRDADSNGKPKCFKVENISDDRFVIVETDETAQGNQLKKGITSMVGWASRAYVAAILEGKDGLSLTELVQIISDATGVAALAIRKKLKSATDLDDLHINDIWSIKGYDL
jgi:hypothetical protein